MIEQKVKSELLTAYLDRILAADEREAHSEFQQKIANVVDQGALEFPLAGFFRNREEVEVVRVLNDLLGQSVPTLCRVPDYAEWDVRRNPDAS